MPDDICPRCEAAFQIVRIRFGWTGARLLYACPKCEPDQSDEHLSQPQRYSHRFLPMAADGGSAPRHHAHTNGDIR